MTMSDLLNRAHHEGARTTKLTIKGGYTAIVFSGADGSMEPYHWTADEAEAAMEELASVSESKGAMPRRHGCLKDPSRLGLPPDVTAVRYMTTGTGDEPWQSHDRSIDIRFIFEGA